MADKKCIETLIFAREDKSGGKEVVEDVEWAKIEAAQTKNSCTRCTSKKLDRILVAIRRLLNQNLMRWNSTMSEAIRKQFCAHTGVRERVYMYRDYKCINHKRRRKTPSCIIRLHSNCFEFRTPHSMRICRCSQYHRHSSIGVVSVTTPNPALCHRAQRNGWLHDARDRPSQRRGRSFGTCTVFR